MIRRLLASLLAIAAWLILLFSGVVLGGAVHLLLVAALVFFPWKAPPATER